MAKFQDKLNDIEVNLGQVPNPDGYVKIDGKKIEGIRSVQILSGLLTGRINDGIPIVKVEFYAKSVKGTIGGKVLNMIGFPEGIIEHYENFKK